MDKVSNIKFGAGMYTWFMHHAGKTFSDRLDHMIRISAQAGFSGIEPMHFWMGSFNDPYRLKDVLDKHGIALCAIALVLDWNEEEETIQERLEADQTIRLLQHFPGSKLCTVQMPTSRSNIEIRRRRLLRHVNAVSRRAKERGIECSFHPNSPHHSITRTEEDYSVLLEGLDTAVTGWTPDVGHIINGGMDPLSKMREYQSLINHVHFKDWNGDPEFVLMGAGKVDFAGITNWLHRICYNGWIVCEDEGTEALTNPDAVTIHDGGWVQRQLLTAQS